jgi:Asp-tRNA(Asn)/Glu-tRNA(Gln) amidotransferase A subunit family amidase
MSEGAENAVALARRAAQGTRAWPGIVTDLEDVLERAYARATEVDRRRADGAGVGPLAGLPVLVKDNVDIAGLVSGQGGMLGRHRARTDSFAWSRLQAEGSILLGHTAMHELAWGLTTPGCPNPWGVGLTPGGSSGGAAASVAAGIVPVAIGTDTGGSIRVPAALCGVAGLRPTHGTAPMDGIAALAPSLDTVGVLARTADDCVFTHELIAGHGAPGPDGLEGLRVGVLGGWQGRVSPGVADAVADSCAVLRASGVQIIDVHLRGARLAPSIAYVLMLIESARRWLAQAERQPGEVGAEVLEQLREGGRIDTGDTYRHALDLARSLRGQLLQTVRHERLAAILSPVTATTGVRVGTDAVTALSRYTGLASVTGLPALSVPAGLESGCPVAVQLIGLPYAERSLALLAGPIEQGPGRIVADQRKLLRPFRPKCLRQRRS